MDKPAEFYYNYEKETPAMTPGDYEERRMERSRANEVGKRNSQFVPTLSETFFGDAQYLTGTSFSIKKERGYTRAHAQSRALELGRRRKLTSASEKHKFF